MAGVTKTDREGTQSSKRLPKQTNTPRDVHRETFGKAASADEASRSFEGVFDKTGSSLAKMERGAKGGHGRHSRRAEHLENSTQGLALNSGSVHPVFRLPVHCHTGVQ